MTDLLRIAMDGEWAAWQRSPNRPQDVHGRTLRASFMMGMATRIGQRLKQLKEARTDAGKAPVVNGGSNRNALVVVKTQVTTEKWAQFCKETGLKLRSNSTRRANTANGDAYAAGKAAGDRVDLGGAKLGSARAALPAA